MRAFIYAIVVSLALSGCSGEDPGLRPYFPDRAARLNDEMRVDGHVEDLVPIGALAVSDNGVVAVNQAQDGLIRFFAPSGEALGSFGRRGEGPGEFMNPVRLGWMADTLWVYDGRLQRLTFVSPELSLAGIVSNIPEAARPAPEDAGHVPEFPFTYIRAVLPDRSLLAAFGLAVNQDVPERFQNRTSIGRMTADGVIANIIVLLPPPEGGGVTSPQGGSASLPYGNRAAYAIAPRLGQVVVAMASVDGREAGTFSLAAVSLGGDTLFENRYPFEA